MRLESVAIGASVSLVVGAVFWPRGNRKALHDATAALYRSVAAYLAQALGTVTGAVRADSLDASRRAALAAQQRADQSVFDLLVTPNATASVPAWSRLSGVGRSLRLVADGVGDLNRLAVRSTADGRDHPAFDALGAARVDAIAQVADRLDDEAAPVAAASREASDAWFARLEPADVAAVERSFGLVWAVEWLAVVDTLLSLDDEPLETVAAAADVAWWG